MLKNTLARLQAIFSWALNFNSKSEIWSLKMIIFQDATQRRSCYQLLCKSTCHALQIGKTLLWHIPLPKHTVRSGFTAWWTCNSPPSAPLFSHLKCIFLTAVHGNDKYQPNTLWQDDLVYFEDNKAMNKSSVCSSCLSFWYHTTPIIAYANTHLFRRALFLTRHSHSFFFWQVILSCIR